MRYHWFFFNPRRNGVTCYSHHFRGLTFNTIFPQSAFLRESRHFQPCQSRRGGPGELSPRTVLEQQKTRASQRRARSFKDKYGCDGPGRYSSVFPFRPFDSIEGNWESQTPSLPKNLPMTRNSTGRTSCGPGFNSNICLRCSGTSAAAGAYQLIRFRQLPTTADLRLGNFIIATRQRRRVNITIFDRAYKLRGETWLARVSRNQRGIIHQVLAIGRPCDVRPPCRH